MHYGSQAPLCIEEVLLSARGSKGINAVGKSGLGVPNIIRNIGIGSSGIKKDKSSLMVDPD